MASINNLEEAASVFLESATITETEVAGVDLASSGGIEVLTSATEDVSTTDGVSSVLLTGDADLNVEGDDAGNVVVANDGSNDINTGAGDDQVTTGAGDDNVSLGDGNDVVEVTGSGVKTIDGGAGDDLFVINKAGADGPADSTLTGLNVGDTVRVTVTDANGDGQIDFDDVDITTSENGSLVFTLSDGTSFTLDGVGPDSATNGDIVYTLLDNGDGTFDVELKSALDDG